MPLFKISVPGCEPFEMELATTPNYKEEIEVSPDDRKTIITIKVDSVSRGSISGHKVPGSEVRRGFVLKELTSTEIAVEHRHTQLTFKWAITKDVHPIGRLLNELELLIEGEKRRPRIDSNRLDSMAHDAKIAAYEFFKQRPA